MGGSGSGAVGGPRARSMRHEMETSIFVLGILTLYSCHGLFIYVMALCLLWAWAGLRAAEQGHYGAVIECHPHHIYPHSENYDPQVFGMEFLGPSEKVVEFLEQRRRRQYEGDVSDLTLS